VDGPGSTWQIAGALQIGNAAAGMLSVTAGGTVTAAALDAGVQNTGTQDGAGQVNLVGAGSEVMVTGNATIGDAATGAMSILNGATFAATDLTIGGATGNGVVTVSGAGSRVNLSGTLDVGTTLGVGELTIGPSATVVAASAVLHGQVVNEGGLLDATTIDVTSGFALVGYGAFGAAGGLIVNSGTIDADGGTIVASGTATGTGEWLVSNGSTLDLTGAVDSTQSVVFATASGALVVEDIAGFQGVVTQFTTGGKIFVDTSSAATFSRTGSAVSVIAGGTTLGVVNFASAALAATATGGGLVDQIVPCFAAGTRISTERGEVPVEELKVGDLVQVIGTVPSSLPPPARGGGGLAAQPIIWLGCRTVDCVGHPQPRKVWPVRIRSGAFGPGRPCDDLWLSPDHAVFVGDVLIPVKYLINGVTIAQVPVQEVTYYHVELPHHAVLLAEGLPAESYLDTGDRTNFANGGGPITLYPDFSSHVWDAEGCALLVVTGPELDSARHWVNALAHDLYGRNGAARYRAAG
jgi:T5SS/PEP-CTERM-associated repeat protein